MIDLMIAGQPVDWAAAETRYPADAALIRQLQSIGRLARGREALAADSGTARASPALWARRAHVALAAIAGIELVAALVASRLGYAGPATGVPAAADAVV